MRHLAFLVVLAAGVPTTCIGADFAEIEPNESKAQALANGAFVLAPGDAVTGTSSGFVSTPGAASADVFLIRTTPLPLAIYRHRLTISSSESPGHTGAIRGLASNSRGPRAETDLSMQASAAAAIGTTPARTNQWYAFGKQEQLYFRVSGTLDATGMYRAELSTEAIQPTRFPLGLTQGQMSINHNAETDLCYDRDMFVFDSDFNPIVGVDEPEYASIELSLPAGTYYVAYGRANTSAGTLAGEASWGTLNGVVGYVNGIRGTRQDGAVLDFANAVVCASMTSASVPVTLSVSSFSGSVATTVTATAPALSGAHDIAWFELVVSPVCPMCAADYDENGGVNAADVVAFIADVQMGSPCADIDQDGGLTGADLSAFFNLYEAGGC